MRREDGRLTLLERLDLALAARIALQREQIDFGRPEDLRTAAATGDLVSDALWVTRVLGLRGLAVARDEAERVLRVAAPPAAGCSQEARLMFGMGTILQTIRRQSDHGKAPDGWGAVAMFRDLTNGIPRFRANAIRRDDPWDGVFGVDYPRPDALPSALEDFCEHASYGDDPAHFSELHPVRRSVQLMWTFARIAPFPDFNGVMAFVMMNAYLLSQGYPMVTPQPEDKQMLTQLVLGPKPQRVVQFESRLVDAVGG